MKKMKLFRTVLAGGMAFALAAAPMSAGAEMLDETELAAVQDEIDDALEEYSSSASATEGVMYVEFGDAFYNLGTEDGTDLTWLENCSLYGKVVPGEESLDAEVIAGMNDSTLCSLLVSYNPESGLVYFSVPELFDQTIAVNPQEFASNLMSGKLQQNASMQEQMIRMLVGVVMKAAGQLADFFQSLPEEVWQQELNEYIMPIMSNLQQNVEEEVLTAGSLSADVQTQILTIPSDAMEGIITGILDSLANDQVIEGLLQSDAVSTISSLVSQLSGGTVNVSGQALLDQMREGLKSVASMDFSSIPGICVRISGSEDGNAAGCSLALAMGEETYDLVTFKAIQDGTEHAFEFTPSENLLAMIGAGDAVGSINVIGEGSTAGGMLNEDVKVFVNDETVAAVTITDLDLEALENGDMIGTLRFDIMDQSAEITYGVEEDGTRTIVYRFNDELFYSAAVWTGEAADDEIDPINLENVIEITSVNDIVNWFGTLDMEALAGALAQAGAPVAEVAETEEIAS